MSTDETCAGGFVDDTLDISLNVGQSDTVCWKIEPDRLAGVDSGFAVTGTITITNNAPIAANGVSVSDAIAGFGAATVDCGSGATTVDIAASGSAQCTYSASLPDATDRNNTATATLAGTDYTGSTLIDFGAPTTVTDESATLDDDRGPNPPIPASYTDTDPNDTPVTYTEVLTCGDSRTESNTADLTETDTNTHRTDPAAVALECIPPSEGCTPGFWKTHPELWDGNSAVADVTTTIQTTDLFNATFGVTSGQSGLLDTRDLLYALDVSTATIDVSGLDSNLAALDRHAAAALVSADATGVDYAFTVAQVIAIYQDAVGAIAGPETISSALAKLQAENERGCPL